MPSKKETIRRWLNDIQYHVSLVEKFTSGMNYETFQDDDRTLYAVTRCLEIISEASRRLPDTLKTRHPKIQWREMAAAGNIYRHEYEGVAARRLWRTVTVSLPPLRAVIERELAREPDQEDDLGNKPY